MRRIFKYLLIFFLLMVVVLIVAIGSTGYWLTTASGQQWLNQTITSTVKEQTGYTLNYQGINITPWNTFFLNKVTLADQNGIWLSAEKFKIQLTPDRLWQENTLTIDLIDLDSLYVIRAPLPSTTGSPPEEDPASTPADPDAYSPNIKIGQASIQNILLGKQLVQQPQDIALNFTSSLDWEGQNKVAQLQAKINALSPLYEGLSLTEVSLDAQFDTLNQALSINTFLLEDKAQKIESKQLNIDLANNVIQGDIEIKDFILNPWVPDINGILSGFIHVSGDVSLPSLNAELTVKDTAYQDNQLETIQLAANISPETDDLWHILAELSANSIGLDSKIDAQLDQSKPDAPKLNLQKAYLTLPNSQLEAQVTCTFPCQHAQGRIIFDSTDLNDFGKHINLDLKGSTQLAINLKLPSDSQQEPRQFVDIDLSVEHLDTPWAQLESLNLKGFIQHLYGLRPDELTLNLSNAQANTLQIDSLDITTDKISEHAIKFTVASLGLIEQAFDANIQGEMDTENFTLFHILLNQLEGQWGNLSFNQLEPSTYRHHIQKQSTQWSIPGITLNKSLLSSEGYLTEESIQSTLRLSEFSLNDIPLELPPQISQSIAKLNVQLSGQLESPNFKAEANLDNLLLQEGQDPIDIQGNVEYRQEKLKVHLQSNDQRIANNLIEAQMPLTLSLSPFHQNITENTPITGSLKIDTLIDPWVKSLEIDGHQLTGHIKGDLSIDGLISSPLILGTLDLKDSRYENPKLGVTLDSLKASLEFSEEAVVLKQLQAIDKQKGKFEGQGTLHYQTADVVHLNYQLQFNADKFAPLEQETFTTELNGKINITGDQNQGTVTGDLSLVPMHIQIPEQFEEGVSELNFVEDSEPTEGASEEKATASPPSKPYELKLDINLLAEQQVFVRGWGLDTEWGGQLKVQGHAHSPNIAGNLQLKRGRYEDFNKKFKLEDGNLNFSGAIPPSPFIRLVAMTKVEDYEIRPNFSGSVIKPKLDISTSPTLPKDEAMSLLLFGKSSKEITPLQAIQLASSLRRLAGYGSDGGFDPLGTARDILHVDDITIGNDSDNPQATTVGVGKYISDKVYLQVEGGSEPGSGKAKLEIEISDNVTVDSTTTEDNKNSIGLKFKKDY